MVLSGELKQEVKCDIKRHIGVISERKNGWKFEVNEVSWNDFPAKIDIRAWDENHEYMSKGITISLEEAECLVQILQTEIQKSAVVENEENEKSTKDKKK